MKHIVAFAIGSYGDVEPFVVLGKELKRRGYEFSILTFPDHKERIEKNGLNYLYMHGDLSEMTRSLLSESGGANACMNRLKEMLETTEGLYEDFSRAAREADLLMYMQFGGLAYHFAESFGIPCVRTFVYPFDTTRRYSSMFPNIKDGSVGCAISYIASDIMMNRISCKTANLYRKKLGLGRWNYLSSYKRMNGERLLTLYQYSSALAPKDEKWGPRVHLTGPWFEKNDAQYIPDSELERFLERGEPPVYIGYGSMVYSKMEQLQEVIISALQQTGMRAILGSGYTKFRKIEDPNIFFADFIPYDWLFPRVSAVIHHGGCGTTHLGLRYGRPTWIIAFGGDQEFWGDRVWKEGLGPKPVYINKAGISTEDVADALTRLRSGIYDKAAADMSVRLSDDKGVTMAADLIEREIAEATGER